MKEVIKATAAEIMLAVTVNEPWWTDTPEEVVHAIYKEIEEAGSFFDAKNQTMYRLGKADTIGLERDGS